MHNYPSVNWWKGNLRQHESYLSLVVRFAYLNGIKLGQACEFLDTLLGNRSRPGEADLTRLADGLTEDRATLQTVVCETIQLTPCPGSTIPSEKADGSLRYCEQCAAAGYHSYLHEHLWLSSCPLHNMPLHVVRPGTRGGSLFVRTGNALAQVMSSACSRWPTAAVTFRPEQFAGVAWLSRWTVSAAAKGRQLTDHAIWSSQSAVFRDSVDFGKAIGQLHALEPVPAAMAPMFAEFEQDWAVKIRHFSPPANAALAPVALGGLQRIFSVYQRLTAYADPAHRVVAALDACRASLQARHVQCRCRWGRESLAYSNRWVPVRAEDWPMCTLTCPNAVARAELELAVGRRYESLSTRRQFEERVALSAEASSLAAQGLVVFADETDMAQKDLLFSSTDGWRSMRWVGNPGLNEIFEEIACAEIELVQEALIGWLDSIDGGRHPALYTGPGRGPQLCKTAEALRLVTWTRRAGRSVVAAACDHD